MTTTTTENPSLVNDTMGSGKKTRPEKMAYGAQCFSYLGIVDNQGRQRIGMGCDERDVPFIAMWDTKGKIRMKLQLGVRGYPAKWCSEPEITMYDENGKRRASVGVNNGGDPCMWFEDKEGNSLWHSPPLDKFIDKKPRKKRGGSR